VRTHFALFDCINSKSFVLIDQFISVSLELFQVLRAAIVRIVALFWISVPGTCLVFRRFGVSYCLRLEDDGVG